MAAASAEIEGAPLGRGVSQNTSSAGPRLKRPRAEAGIWRRAPVHQPFELAQLPGKFMDLQAAITFLSHHRDDTGQPTLSVSAAGNNAATSPGPGRRTRSAAPDQVRSDRSRAGRFV